MHSTDLLEDVTDSEILDRESPESLELAEILKLKEEYDESKSKYQMLSYKPYPYQREFHRAVSDAGGLARQRCLMAANKVGKTFSGAMELSYHLTGWYPDWWEGKKFSKPILAWAAGQSHYNTRDILQAELLGEPGDKLQFGKAALPLDLIVDTDRNPGVPNAYASVIVKHKSGMNSKLFFKSYDSGPESFMGKAVDVVWFDELCGQAVYSQALRATLKTGGLVYLTYTPEKGMDEITSQFINSIKPGQALYRATWDDASHLTKDIKDEILAALPDHERKMRSQGVPVLGSGVVFPIPEEDIKCDSFTIPAHWSRMCAIDFGWNHPTAVVWLCHCRDSDTIYLYDAYRQANTTILVHAHAIKQRGDWIPCVWPHDGAQHDKGSGVGLSQQYRRAGVEMVGQHFTNPDGSISVEPGLQEILTRFQTGRLKVFSHLGDWFEEFRMYHRKDGKVVRVRDDLMSATRYGVQSIGRFGRTGIFKERPEKALGAMDYDPFEMLEVA